MKNKLLSAAIASGICISPALHAQTLYGVTNANAIFTITDINSPGSISGPYSVSGVASGQALVGLDSRSSDGSLYALGYDSVAHMAELYRITGTGGAYTAAAVSGTLASMDLGTTNNVTFDFVSTADDQLRIIGRNGNNYMMSAVSGAVTATGTSGLSFASGDLYAASTAMVAATAYTNSFYGADATDQVGYDAVNNVLVHLDAGTYANGFNNASNTAHSIGTTTGVVFSTGGSIGMDSWYNNVSHSNTVYLTGSTLLTGAHLYKYDMTSVTGTLTDMGAIGTGSLNVRDIAFASTSRDMGTAITGQMMTALSLNLRHLVFFDSEHPGNIRKSLSLTGMTSGQTMVAIDYNYAGTLYGLGYNSGSHMYQLYTIDTVTGNLTAVNSSALAINLGSDDGSGLRLNIGMRFIATATNRIRVIGSNGTNTQLDATTGAVVATDANAQYATGDTHFGATANLSSVAYTGYPGDASTQMFGFDASTGVMVTFDAHNDNMGFGDGTSGYISTGADLSTVLSLLLHTNLYNNAHMNIAYSQSAAANMGFMAANYLGDSSDQLNYSILYDMSDMLTTYHKGTSSTPTPNGSVGYGIPVKDVAMPRTYNTTGIYTLGNNAAGLLMYPNPATSNTHVMLPAAPSGKVLVDVVDMNGSIVRSYTYAPLTYDLDIDLSTLPTGMYSVRVFGKGIPANNLKVLKN